MSKTKITSENIGEIFNEVIYPTLDSVKNQKDVSSVTNELLKKYEFSDETDKIRFLIPVINVFTKTLMNEMGIDYNNLNIGLRNQIGWNFVNEWFNGGEFMPMKLINYADVLSTESGMVFENLDIIDSETFGWLKKEAVFILEGVEKGNFEVTDEQKKHLESIKDGNLPYGLRGVEAPTNKDE